MLETDPNRPTRRPLASASADPGFLAIRLRACFLGSLRLRSAKHRPGFLPSASGRPRSR